MHGHEHHVCRRDVALRGGVGVRGRRRLPHPGVLDRELAVFWSRGYPNTTTRDLEAELGITQSSLYNAFGSKAGLLDAVLEQYQAAVDHSLLGPLRQAQDGRAGLSAFFRDLGESMALDGRGCLMVNLMADEAPTNPAIAARTLAHRDRLRASLHVAVNRLCGDLGAATVEHRTDLLLATTLGLNIAARGGASAAEIGRLVAGVEAEVAEWSS